jgi:hypothetical protein
MEIMEMYGAIDLRHEALVCQFEDCIDCPALDGCNDAIGHIKNTLRKRFRGEITHDELLTENYRRFGPDKRKSTHWKDIVGEIEQQITAIVRMQPEQRQQVYAKMGQTERDVMDNIFDRLSRNSWFKPFLDDEGKLHFHYATGNGKESIPKPVTKKYQVHNYTEFEHEE